MVSICSRGRSLQRTRQDQRAAAGHTRPAVGEPRHALVHDPPLAAHRRNGRVQDARVQSSSRVRSEHCGQLVASLAARRDHQRAQDPTSDRREFDSRARSVLFAVRRDWRTTTTTVTRSTLKKINQTILKQTTKFDI